MVAASRCIFLQLNIPRVDGLPSVKELCDVEEGVPQNAPPRSQIMGFLRRVVKVVDLLRC